VFVYRLNFFNSSSGLTRIQMPASVIDPQHAIIAAASHGNHGNVYVGYGWKSNKPNTLAMLTIESRVLAEATIPLNFPRHLAFDSDESNVFVADYGNRRVCVHMLHLYNSHVNAMINVTLFQVLVMRAQLLVLSLEVLSNSSRIHVELIQA